MEKINSKFKNEFLFFGGEKLILFVLSMWKLTLHFGNIFKLYNNCKGIRKVLETY
jgi:hypothetical protein